MYSDDYFLIVIIIIYMYVINKVIQKIIKNVFI